MILDLDNYIKDWKNENEGFFDYKNFFKNSHMIRKMSQSIVTSYKKQLVHHKEDSFNGIYDKTIANYSRDHLG